jgi:predicted solute-binding protein
MALAMDISFTNDQAAVINKEAANQSRTPEEVVKTYLDSWVVSLEKQHKKELERQSKAAFDALPAEKRAEVLRLLGT